jgi:hypothetical protein
MLIVKPMLYVQAPVRLRFKISFRGGSQGVVQDQFDWAEKKA